MLKKVTQDRTDINLAILSWRNTPTEGGKYSPVQKLHSRRTRTQLPTSSKLLEPKVASGVVDESTLRKQRTKQQYDRIAKELPHLVDGKTVRMQPVKHNRVFDMNLTLGQTGPTQTSAAPLVVYYWTNQLYFIMN